MFGIDATNTANGTTLATASQLITLSNSSVTAWGDYDDTFGIRASNGGSNGSADHTIALAGRSVATYDGEYDAAISLSQNVNSTGGYFTQALTAVDSSIVGYGYAQNAVRAGTYSEYAGATVVQTVVLASNDLTAPSDTVVSLYAGGNAYQVGTVTGNSVYGYTGVFMNTSGGNQIVTVVGQHLQHHQRDHQRRRRPVPRSAVRAVRHLLF